MTTEQKRTDIVDDLGQQASSEQQPTSETNNWNILSDAKEKATQDVKVNTEGWTNTGTGIDSAVGTNYSWEKKGQAEADTQYKIDANSAKQSMLENQQQINSNAINYQSQADMNMYQRNQEAEKVGWAGGYVLDKNRQNEYLKQSIQAQMYGAMELQKYGYESSLAAARLSYDLNMQNYADQYYQEAVSNALNEAQITGVYFSAEVRDMMSQLGTANQILSSAAEGSAEYEKATQIRNQINNWFNENQISQEGVKTASMIYQEIESNKSWFQDLYTIYSSVYSALQTKMDSNSALQIYYNDQGDPMFDGTTIKTIDLSKATDSELVEYGMSSQTSRESLYGYFDSLMYDAINKLRTAESYTDSNGKQTFTYTEDQLREAMKVALDRIKRIEESLDPEDPEYQAKLKMIEDYRFEINETYAVTPTGGIGASDDVNTVKIDTSGNNTNNSTTYGSIGSINVANSVRYEFTQVGLKYTYRIKDNETASMYYSVGDTLKDKSGNEYILAMYEFRGNDKHEKKGGASLGNDDIKAIFGLTDVKKLKKKDGEITYMGSIPNAQEWGLDPKKQYAVVAIDKLNWVIVEVKQ